jgi:hypothetical protein
LAFRQFDTAELSCSNGDEKAASNEAAFRCEVNKTAGTNEMQPATPTAATAHRYIGDTLPFATTAFESECDVMISANPRFFCRMTVSTCDLVCACGGAGGGGGGGGTGMGRCFTHKQLKHKKISANKQKQLTFCCFLHPFELLTRLRMSYKMYCLSTGYS